MLNTELLSQYRSIRREMIELEERIQNIYSAAMFPKSSEITGMPRSPGFSSDGMSRVFEKIEELVAQYQEKLVQLSELCLEIEKQVDDLPSFDRRIIRLRYLDGKPWSEIHKITGYSVAQLHRIHNKIFEKN